jgi:hypothetical protein
VSLGVLAGHLIGDWIVQTDWQAANKVRPEPIPKGDPVPVSALNREMQIAMHRAGIGGEKLWRESWRANQAHMLGYHTALVVCCWRMPPRRLARLLVVSWVTHSFIDRRWPVKWLMEHTGSAPFSETSWGPMCVDQALHLSILALLSEDDR